MTERPPMDIENVPPAWYARRAARWYVVATLALWTAGAALSYYLPDGWRPVGHLVVAQGTYFGYCATNRYGWARGYLTAIRHRDESDQRTVRRG